MSVKIIEKEIQRFLSNDEPETICIMGKWGVGKTFAWNQYLKNAVSNHKIALEHYSYVSLFGRNSLEELRYAIFENTIEVNQLDIEPDFVTLKGILENSKSWRKSTSLLKFIPRFNEFFPFFAKSFFLTVRKQIICIDDLERIGDGLSTKDILGLVSFLKDQRKCKIVLLLNDEELTEEASKDFEKQLEKVIDVEMRFEPTPLEAVDIGVDKSTSFEKRFSQVCIGLEITNIRVIRKIQRFLKNLERLLSNYDKRIFEAALPSVVLFCWIIYQPKLAPSLDFVKNFHSFGPILGGEKHESEPEKMWRLLLGAIKFSNFDEFDGALLKSVQMGYFDSDIIEKAAFEFSKELILQDQNNVLRAAWEKYHGSFKNNADEILDEMHGAFKVCVHSISPMNLDGTVGLFRTLGRDIEANEMIADYVSKRKETADFFDPQRSTFLALKDQVLKKAFEDKLATFKDERSPVEILLQIARVSGWNPEDISALAHVSEDEFYKIFKETEGDDLDIVVNQALKMARYDQSDPQYKIISSNAEKALRRIALESDINRLRVMSYGVTVDTFSESKDQTLLE
jgi:hypothetical protein